MKEKQNASTPGQQAKRVLVCGATGYLGGYVLRAAQARGHWVRALVRSRERFGEREGQVEDVFVGQATDPTTLAGLCEGIDVVFSSLGNHTIKRKPTCWEVDYQANINILDQARDAGVEQFVFVSVLNGDRMRGFVPQIEARERVVDSLKAGSMPWTIVRPSGFFNDILELLEMARRGSVWVAGDGRQPFNPVHGPIWRSCVSMSWTRRSPAERVSGRRPRGVDDARDRRSGFRRP